METETQEVTGKDVEQQPDEQSPEVDDVEAAKPEVEQQPEQDADELIKALTPEAKPKPKRKRAKAKAKPKAEPKKQAKPKQDDEAKAKEQERKAKQKAQQEQRDLKARYTELNEKQAKDGSTAGMERAMRNTCEKLGRKVPKWAQARGKGEPKTPRIVNDEDLRLAHRMNSLVFHVPLEKDGRFDASKVDIKKAKFGAVYNTSHVQKIREAIKGKDILKELKISRKQLEDFAKASTQLGQKVDLPEETRKAIRAFMAENFKPIDKIWARKFAGGAVVLLDEQAKQKRRSKAAAKKSSKPTATKTAV